jgi:hypothetical protein
MTRACLAFGLIVGCWQTSASCEEPKKEQSPAPAAQPIEIAPPPHPTGNLLLPVVPVYAPPEHGRRTVWQLYGVDITGRFRPRVIHSPYGAYYLYNFAPYPWTTVHPLQYMPYAVD